MCYLLVSVITCGGGGHADGSSRADENFLADDKVSIGTP